MTDAKNMAQENLKRIALVPGSRYRHYKGGEYEVVTCALQEDTLEPVVIYKALGHRGTVWVRTIKNWNEEVKFEGTRVKRFEKIGSA